MKFSCTRGAPYEYHEVSGPKAIDLFSVSQVRKVAFDPYLGIPLDVLEAARRRGEILHRRFWKLLASRVGLIEAPAIIPEFEGYCVSMDTWAEKRMVTPIKVEETSANIELRIAGTPDAKTRMGKKQRRTLTDLKSGQPTLTDPMQLLAYGKMDGYTDVEDYLDLYIQADGSEAHEEFVTSGEKITEWAWFLTALNLLRCRRNHGIKT